MVCPAVGRATAQQGKELRVVGLHHAMRGFVHPYLQQDGRCSHPAPNILTDGRTFFGTSLCLFSWSCLVIHVAALKASAFVLKSWITNTLWVGLGGEDGFLRCYSPSLFVLCSLWCLRHILFSTLFRNIGFLAHSSWTHAPLSTTDFSAHLLISPICSSHAASEPVLR